MKKPKNRLKDFRLKNYDERMILTTALDLYRSRYGESKDLAALFKRVSRTHCQPGGCEYCRTVDND